MTDFEAVDESSLMIDENSGQAWTASAGTPSITLTSPNGGERWQPGTSHTITWNYSGDPGMRVKIVLLQGDTEVSPVTGSVITGRNGTGSYTWPMPAGTVSGSNFKISIQSINKPAINDVSDDYFTITAALQAPETQHSVPAQPGYPAAIPVALCSIGILGAVIIFRRIRQQ